MAPIADTVANRLGHLRRRAPISYSLYGPRLGSIPRHLLGDAFSACGSQLCN